MSKKKSTKSKKRKRKASQTKKGPIIKPLLIWIFTIVGFAASIVIFLPRPMVSPPSIPLNENDIFSVSFDIYNNGFIPLYDCTAYCAVGQIVGKNKKLDPSLIPTFESRFLMPAWRNHKLGIDERFTIVLSDLMNNVGAADIAIVVSYQPWFLPLPIEKIFRFVTFKQKNDLSFWRSWPIGESLPKIP